MNGATCTEGKCTDAACLVQYNCGCASGFAGIHCEVDTDECASYPCLNGATCVDMVGTYRCVCPAGYRGKCEDLIDNIQQISRNLKSATCEEARKDSGLGCSFSLQQYKQPGKTITDFCRLTCKQCLAENCQVDINECVSVPCKNGATCSDSTSSVRIKADQFVCTCAAGYANGKQALCEVDINECASSPCLHGGKCSPGQDSYTCTCKAGYRDIPVGTCLA